MIPDWLPEVAAAAIAAILAITLHEAAHGYAALWLGDDTAQRAGRISINPLRHVDMMGTIMLGGTLGAAHDKKMEAGAAAGSGLSAAPGYCRDPGSTPQYGIYRVGGASHQYVMALGDTGTSLSVSSYDLGPLITPSRGYLVVQSDGVTEQIYPPFTALPSPEQVLALPGKVSPVFSAGLLPGDDKRVITVPSK